MSASTAPVVVVGSPLRGWCSGLEDSPDPVFRDRVLGDGLSIDPFAGEVRAPFDGEVIGLPESRHAINLRTANGLEMLIHVGIDTVGLGGQGFRAHVKTGDRIERGQLLLEFDMDTALRGATSLRSPVLVLASCGYEIEGARAAGPVDFGEPLYEARAVARKASTTAHLNTTGEVSRALAVGLEHGIHARPAAALIEALGAMDATVFIRRGERPPANAASAVALMSLGVAYGDRVTVSATGADAETALQRVVQALQPLADDALPPQPSVVSDIARKRRTDAITPPPKDGTVINAVPASPGLGLGPAWRPGSSALTTSRTPASAEGEWRNIETAMTAVGARLRELAAGEGAVAAIAGAHLALLADPLIVDAARRHVGLGVTAEAAWSAATAEAIDTLAQVDDARLRERADDLRDIELRVLRALAGADPSAAPAIRPGSVMLAENLLPSQLMELGSGEVAGICLAAGGATSHVAILAMSLEIPMLVAAGNLVHAIEEGADLQLDAELGELQVRPDAATRESFQGRVKADRARRVSEQEHALEPCVSADGVRIHVHANIGSAQDALAAVKGGAEGCGLLRTEFIFMERHTSPSADEQQAVYQRISDTLGTRPLVVRTLDAGGDKPIDYIEQTAEENPALGVRGIRLCLERPDLLENQLRALLRLERETPLQVMIPMVSQVDEVLQVRQLLERLQHEEQAATGLSLGVMIETPAAALIADRLAECVDFFSIGTNDLTQYTLCMDRGEPRLATQLDALHPAVLKLIKSTVQAAQAANIPVAVCGGAAGDILAAPLLVGLGVRELSMAGTLIARQKARLREVAVSDCERLARQALAMRSAREVRQLMRTFILAPR